MMLALFALFQTAVATLPDTSVIVLFQKGGISLLVGLLVGLERERAQEKDSRFFAGIRTFPLIALLGFLCALLGTQIAGWLLGVFAAGFMLLIVIAYYVEAREGSIGGTSEVAAIMVFVFGILIHHEFYIVATAGSVVLTLFLSIKDPLQQLIARVQREDIYATLKFAIITAIILPILPDRTFGPLDVLNPRHIWYMVVLIAGISFLGFVLVKVFGSKRGLTLSGILGGLVSSTAVTLSFSHKSRETPELGRTFASGIVLACSIMFPRILIEVAVINMSLLDLIWPYVLILTVSGVVASLLLLFGRSGKTETDIQLKNPFELKSAIQFGLIFAVILFASKAAELYLGDGGVYLTAALAGLTDVDAITLSMANLSRTTLSEHTAAVAILIAAVSNTLVKAGITVVLGATALRRSTLPGFGIIIATGLLLIAWLLLF